MSFETFNIYTVYNLLSKLFSFYSVTKKIQIQMRIYKTSCNISTVCRKPGGRTNIVHGVDNISGYDPLCDCFWF